MCYELNHFESIILNQSITIMSYIILWNAILAWCRLWFRNLNSFNDSDSEHSSYSTDSINSEREFKTSFKQIEKIGWDFFVQLPKKSTNIYASLPHDSSFIAQTQGVLHIEYYNLLKHLSQNIDSFKHGNYLGKFEKKGIGSSYIAWSSSCFQELW